MSATIDERIVQMEFDNREFERGIQTSMRSLDNLDKSLQLKNGEKGFERINRAAQSVSFDPLYNGLYAVQQRFSAMEIIAVTALQRVTNMAISTGERLVKSLSVDQIAAGFEKFGSKTTSVATLVAQGNALEDVNDQLNRLNWFTDETSYNFTDMVANIAKFTASGKGLQDSVTAMEGIANWAALSGQNAMTASRAMYQISQAIGAGVMRKEDYKSIQNASMDTAEFREKCLEAGVALGTLKKNADGTYTSLINANGAFEKAQFAEHLTQDAWLTSDVMMQVFTDYSKAVTKIYEVTQEKGKLASEVIDEIHSTADETGVSIDEAIKKLGYIDENGEALFDAFGLKAFEAAQKARTFEDAVDSVKDAVSTGWMKSFELIFGNAEEAADLWTELANRLYDVFAEGINRQNDLLTEWNAAGGRNDFIESLWNLWDAVAEIATTVKGAFSELFPPTTADRLLSITGNLKNFTAWLKLSEDSADKLKRGFKGMFSVLDMFRKVLSKASDAVGDFMGSSGIRSLGDLLLNSFAKVGDALTELNNRFTGNSLGELFQTVFGGISGFIDDAVSHAGGLAGILGGIANTLKNGLGAVWDSVKPFLDSITEHISLKTIFDTLGGLLAMCAGKNLFDAAKGIKNFFDDLLKGLDKTGWIKTNLTEIADCLTDKLQAMADNVKAKNLLIIASAVGVLTLSVEKLSKLKARDLAKSVAAISGLMAVMMKGLDGFTKILNATTTGDNTGKKFGFSNLFGSKTQKGNAVKTAAGLVLLAEAVKILADAAEKLSGLSLTELGKGLAGVGAGIAELAGAAKVLDGANVSISTSLSMLAIAESCKMLADALTGFKDLSWDEIGRGLAGMGGALAEVTASSSILGQFGGLSSLFSAGGILLTVQGLDELARNLAFIGGLSWESIQKGLAGIGGALAEVSAATAITGWFAGANSLAGGGSIFLLMQGLNDIALALQSIGNLDWESIGRGLAGMGGALTEIVGLTAVLSEVAGLRSLFGAGSIWIVTQGLGEIADALGKIGALSSEQLAAGIGGLGLALAEVAGTSGLLGNLAGFAGLIGSGSLLLAIQGLGDLADAFISFANIDPEKMVSGVIAMGVALGETALGGVLNTFSVIGAAAIGAMARPLGDLADSIAKWSGVRVPDGLGSQLGTLANGINTFMFAGWGADSIATLASPLGEMADSIRKWDGVTVPKNIASEMTTLASGVQTFLFSGNSATALSNAAPGIGVLADSVKKWANVTVPADIQTNLISLANGVFAFTFGGGGASALTDAAPALIEMANAMQSWKNVSIPKTLGDDLTSLANGVLSFTFDGLGVDTIASLSVPLTDLANAVLAWQGIALPDGLSDILDTLSAGVKKFTFGGLAAGAIAELATPLGDLADSVKNWQGVVISESLTTGLSNLSGALNTFAGVPILSGTVQSFADICTASVQAMQVDFGAVANGIIELTTAITGLSSITGATKDTLGAVASAVGQVMTAVTNAIVDSEGGITNAVQRVLNAGLTTIANGKESMYSTASELLTRFCSGLTGNQVLVETSASTMNSWATTALRNDYQGWWDAAKYLVEGFAKGVSDNDELAVNAAAAMAGKTLLATKKGLRERSPSKATEEMGKFLDMGLVNGITKFADKVYGAVGDVSADTLDGFGGIFAKIGQLFDADLSNAPVIRPVIDMDAVDAGLAYINGATARLGGSVLLDASVSARNARLTAPYTPATNQNGARVGDVSNVNAPVTNNFYITGNDPEKIYNYISKRMQRDVDRSRKRWDT